MGKPKKARSFLEQLADYDDPTPKDIDPEKDHAERYGEEEAINQEEAREHYVDVGESKLRNSNTIDLGPQYSGASVSRNALENADLSDEEDEPFRRVREDGDSEGEKSEIEEDKAREAFSSDGDADHGDGVEEDDRAIPEASPSTSSISEKGSQDEDNDLESNTSSSPLAQNDRAALRKMMVEEQKSIAASLSAAAKADIAKGKAIKQQRSSFDSLLNTRIKLQKALIATNSMASVPELSMSEPNNVVMDCASASRAAEEAALNLWDSIESLRNTLYSNRTKRPLPPTTETSGQALWKRATYLDSEADAYRRATLTKWSQRTNPVTPLRQQNRFLPIPAQQPLTSVLDQHLTGDNMERAIKRTRIARSCAPIQAASKTVVEDEEIYDDADFYSLLLRELVDRRMADTQSAYAAPPARDIANIVPSRAELKVKKQVDTKASKGRKMRYTVHEKLQNFMAAEDRGSWGERQRAELFGSLLGRRVEMGEADGEEEKMKSNDADVEAGGLKLFGR